MYMYLIYCAVPVFSALLFGCAADIFLLTKFSRTIRTPSYVIDTCSFKLVQGVNSIQTIKHNRAIFISPQSPVTHVAKLPYIIVTIFDLYLQHTNITITTESLKVYCINIKHKYSVYTYYLHTCMYLCLVLTNTAAPSNQQSYIHLSGSTLK